MSGSLISKAISDAFHAFFLQGKITSVHILEVGHINETILVEAQYPPHKYILQRINHEVFKNIPGLMNNIRIVTEHINRKIAEGAAPGFRTLKLFRTGKGELFHMDKKGNAWRLFNYIDETRSFDIVPSPELAY